MQMQINVLQQHRDDIQPVPTVLLELVRNAIRAAAKTTGYSGDRSEVNVLLTDDEGISQFHERYLDDAGVTDVISFPAHTTDDEPALSGGPEETVLGDIVVSRETAARQATEYNHSTEREIQLLVIHGFLHLVGFDDLDEVSAVSMRQAEQKAMAALGTGE